ncbi:MAG: TldD/PmbA family protein [Alphaproteobacteria bacterium]
MSDPEYDIPDLLDDVLARAKRAGADTADAVAANSVSVSHAQRMGKMENLERSESRDLGLRVFVGHRQAIVSSNDWTPEALDALAERAVAMAKTVPADEFSGIADPSEILQGAPPDVDGCDSVEPDPETLVERARKAEGAAMAVDGVTNSEGAEADYSRWEIYLGASNGFSGCYRGSRHTVAVSVLAGEGVGMESDYDYASTVYAEDLEDPEKLGRTAAERAVAKLKPRKGATKAMPIVFDPRVSNGMLRHLAGAINGAAIAKGTSFLKDRMGEQVLSKGIRVVDDPHRRRGLGSKPFDAEGIANGPMALVEDGILQSWVLDLRTARKLGLKTTGHASRGTSGPPSPSTTNLTMEAGSVSPKDLMADIKEGFYVTSMMGMGVNGITGDYSRGASGFWIENGEIAYPVSEMTIAGNLKDMFLNLTPADDLAFKYSTNAPTIRIDGMTAAGM